MAFSRLNNSAAIKGYLAEFERRFVQTSDGVLFVRGEGGPGVRLPSADAASLIAGMRATLIEADKANPLWGASAFPAAIFCFLISILIATLFGYPQTGFALALPVAIGVMVLGPLLGAIRVQVAWRRALTHVDRELARFEPVSDAAVRAVVSPNVFRSVFFVTTTMIAAVIAGLLIASETSPETLRIQIDRSLAALMVPAVLVVIALALLARGYDAFTRRRLSEAEIRDAMAERRRRPLG